MPRTHWVVRQNKLETPKEKDEVNNREIRKIREDVALKEVTLSRYR